MAPFGTWLAKIGLGRYEDVFVSNGIDFDVIRSLSDGDLRELGLTLGDRKRLVQAIARLDEQRTADIVTPVVPPVIASGPHREDAVSPGGERRQLTVMFCDLVGSTALSEKLDPEELRSLLHAYRTLCGDVITRYDGFVARYVGDGILTYFGWPTAHEEDAERAVRAALEIVHTVKRASSIEDLSVRIGIATGPVVVGETAGSGDQSKLAVGSTPNLANRLQALAAADQIVIATATRRLVGSAFALSDLGEQDLKGIAEPVHAWRVERALVSESRFDASHGVDAMTPLVGREEELDLLLRRWSQATDGEGQVVLLSGEPGIGKSRVLNALRQRLEAQAVQALRFQCSPYYVNSAFWPIIDNFERALKFTRNETADSKLDKLEALVVTQYGRPPADIRFVAAILSIPCEERYGPLPLTPQRHKDETLRTLVDITEAAAHKQPSVMLFEDVHWGDPTTLEVLDLLIDRVKTVPLLVVLTHRPEFQSRWSEQGHVGALNLSKLTRTQSAAIVSALAGGKALPVALLEQILTRTDGVPLFVEELTKSILESGELKEAGDHYDYAGAARAITIPTTLRDSLMARLDRFMPVKEIAQIGAAIGREFSHELIAAVALMPPAQLDDALARLGESGLALRRGTPPDAIYTFKHALVQDAAYDSLLKSRRQALHAKIARVIETRFPNMRDTEPEVLAHHHSESGMIAEAVPYWLKAGRLALSRMALSSAIAHLESGLRLIDGLPESPQRNDLELQLRTTASVAWEAFRGWPAPQITEVLFPVLALAKQSGQPNIVARTLWGLWVNPLTQGRIAESLRWANELVSAAEEITDEGLTLIAHMSAMVTHFWLGNLVTAKTHGDTILGLYDTERHGYVASVMNHDPKTLTGLYASHWLWMLGHPDQAARVAEERDAHARSIGHPFDRAFALTTGGHVYDYRGEPEKQRTLANEALNIGREHSMPFISEILAPIVRGVSMLRSGLFEQSLQDMIGGLKLWDGSGARIRSPYTKSLVAEAHAQLGHLNTAIEIVDAMLEQILRPGWDERSHLAEVLRLKGWMLSLMGDPEGAEQNFLASLDWARRQQAKSWELRTSTSLARLWQSQGKRPQAYELLAPVYGWFTEGFDTKDLLEAKALLAELG